jgi:hypothetical protein
VKKNANAQRLVLTIALIAVVAGIAAIIILGKGQQPATAPAAKASQGLPV